MYTCGPTVYHYVTIGNWRTYILGDIVYRALRAQGFSVDYIMNITDVGHLTGDNQGDASQGEDRLEKAKRAEGKNAWDIADFYTKDFLAGFRDLGCHMPKKFTRATEHIAEQINLVKQLEERGFTYRISDGIYFDVRKYEETTGETYGALSSFHHHDDRYVRIEPHPEKKDPRDFALWKFSPQHEQRDMEWSSPWGIGFPGWHIECSAMSMKYLGNQFDIHIGGEDLRETHHPNEIAQSQGATGCVPFVHYWIHGAFLLVDGGRMGKSLGNAYTLTDIRNRGFSPMDVRYFYLTGHYRHQLNFSWESLTAARNALRKLYYRMSHYRTPTTLFRAYFVKPHPEYYEKFISAVADDFNMPQALAIIWEFIKDTNVPLHIQYKTLCAFDDILGLGLATYRMQPLTTEMQELVQKRTQARTEKNWAESDRLRAELEKLGCTVNDTKETQDVYRL